MTTVDLYLAFAAKQLRFAYLRRKHSLTSNAGKLLGVRKQSGHTLLISSPRVNLKSLSPGTLLFLPT